MNYEKKETSTIIVSDVCPVCKRKVSSFTEVCPNCGFPHLKGYGVQSSKITLILKKDTEIKGVYGINIYSKKDLPISIENRWLKNSSDDVDIAAPDNGSACVHLSFFNEDKIDIKAHYVATKTDDGYWWHVLEKVITETSIPYFTPNAVYEIYFKMYTYETTHIFGIKKHHNAVKAFITKIG
ncbi:MAG: zinc ribbon domain-containing protein [Clostridia bacterium]|nr:zinc ribbon domain-containing protein [Clostridia bacterium]